MNDLKWTQTQIRRFKELEVNIKNFPACFSTPTERNKLFQQIEKQHVKIQKTKLSDFLTMGEKSHMQSLMDKLVITLNNQGFIQVTTPTIISKTALEKMTIDDNHPLSKQVYWINEKQCLRPMLAPNLYSLMVDFSRLNHRPIRFFEMGSCFRKESDGAKHNSEFTMLNIVEMGTQKENSDIRLKELAAIITSASGITDFEFESEKSNVYGTTLDVVAGHENIELASGATGPHPLDTAWGIKDSWVGIGFGVERLLMTSSGDKTIGKWGKSLAYQNGIRLSI